MITLTKIAKMANVSLSTASKAFSMSTEVSEETRNIIFDIAKKYGVLKKFYNAKYPKLVVGVICSHYNTPFYPDILMDIQKKLEEYGCDICVASSDSSQMKELELYEYYSMYTDVDAIITIGKSAPVPSDFPLPRIDIAPLVRDERTPSVIMNYEAIREGIMNLYRSGIKKIAFVTNNAKSGRAWKYTKFMREICGDNSENIIELKSSSLGKCGYEAAKSLILSKKVPQAIFCEDDEVAFGVMRALYEEQIKIPEEVAVVGWNNHPFGEYSTPSLSTIHIATQEVVSTSVNMLLKSLSGEPFIKNIEIMSRLIERESSKISN